MNFKYTTNLSLIVVLEKLIFNLNHLCAFLATSNLYIIKPFLKIIS